MDIIFSLALGLSLADGFLFTICSSLLPWLLATAKILSQIVNRSCDNPTRGVGLPQEKFKKENNFSDYLLTFPLENTEKTNDLSSLFSP